MAIAPLSIQIGPMGRLNESVSQGISLLSRVF